MEINRKSLFLKKPLQNLLGICFELFCLPSLWMLFCPTKWMAFNCLELLVSSFLTTTVHVFLLSYISDTVCVPTSVSPSNGSLIIIALHVSSLLSHKPCVPFALPQGSTPLLITVAFSGSLRYVLCPKLFLSFLCPASFPSCLLPSVYHCLCAGFTGAVWMIEKTDFSCSHLMRVTNAILNWNELYFCISQYYEAYYYFIKHVFQKENYWNKFSGCYH